MTLSSLFNRCNHENKCFTHVLRKRAVDILRFWRTDRKQQKLQNWELKDNFIIRRTIHMIKTRVYMSWNWTGWSNLTPSTNHSSAVVRGLINCCVWNRWHFTYFQPRRRSRWPRWQQWWVRERWRTSPRQKRHKLLQLVILRCFPQRCGSSKRPWWTRA